MANNVIDFFGRYDLVPYGTNIKVGNHMVKMVGFTEFRAGILTKHVRK